MRLRLSRLLDMPEPQVDDQGELLPLSAYATWGVERGRYVTRVHPMGRVPAEWRTEIDYALAKRLLPVVARLLDTCEPFAEALADLLPDRTVVWVLPPVRQTYDVERRMPVVLNPHASYDLSLAARTDYQPRVTHDYTLPAPVQRSAVGEAVPVTYEYNAEIREEK